MLILAACHHLRDAGMSIDSEMEQIQKIEKFYRPTFMLITWIHSEKANHCSLSTLKNRTCNNQKVENKDKKSSFFCLTFGFPFSYFVSFSFTVDIYKVNKVDLPLFHSSWTDIWNFNCCIWCVYDLSGREKHSDI